MAINIQGVPDAPGGYNLTGKKIMVHDDLAPLATSTVKVPASSFVGPPGPAGGGGYAAPMWTEAGGDLTAGSNTFTHASLVGATEINFIIVDKLIEIIDEDYTFNSGTGQITRVNNFQSGAKMITPYKPA